MTGMTSFCPKCGTSLSWYELIPLISFGLQRARCRHCGSKISWQYPIIEGITALLFTTVFITHGMGLQGLMTAGLTAVLIPVILIDWKYFLIPNALLIGGIMLWLSLTIILDHEALGPGMIAGGINILTMILISTFGKRIFSRPCLGGGDIKLAAMIGLFLGWELFLLVLWSAAITGAFYGGWRMVSKQEPFLGTRIPFGSLLGGVSIVIALAQDEIRLGYQQWMLLLQ